MYVVKLRFSNFITNYCCFVFCRVPLLGAGSDYTHFILKVGVTCADLVYRFDEKQGISSYPLYHSAYETFHLVDKIMDPTYAVGCTCVSIN